MVIVVVVSKLITNQSSKTDSLAPFYMTVLLNWLTILSFKGYAPEAIACKLDCIVIIINNSPWK